MTSVDKDAEITKLREENERLRAELAAKDGQIGAIGETAAWLRESVGRLHIELTNANNTIAELRERVAELQARRTPTVEQVEEVVGMGHGAWDTISPQEIIDAVLKLSSKGEST